MRLFVTFCLNEFSTIELQEQTPALHYIQKPLIDYFRQNKITDHYVTKIELISLINIPTPKNEQAIDQNEM